MSISKELLQFRAGAPEEILERMRSITADNDGRQWVNLQPWVDDEAMPKVPIWKHLFSGRGFAVPTGTWVPPRPGKSDMAEVGMTHPAGHRAIEQLHEANVETPTGWTLIQDHTKRGLVFDVPAGENPSTIIAWVVQAAAVLAGELPVDDRWVAGFITQE